MSLSIKGGFKPVQGQVKMFNPFPGDPYYYHTQFNTASNTGTGSYSLGDTKVANITPTGIAASEPTFGPTTETYENRVRFNNITQLYYTGTSIYASNGTILLRVIHHNLSNTSFRVDYTNADQVWTTVNFPFLNSTGSIQELRVNHLTGRYEYYIDDVLYWGTDNGNKDDYDWNCHVRINEGSYTESTTQLLPDPN